MRKTHSKRKMKPFLLDYLVNFGTEWQDVHGRFSEWFRGQRMDWDGSFQLAMRFGFLEYKRQHSSRTIRLQGHEVELTSIIIRITPKGLRRIASRSH